MKRALILGIGGQDGSFLAEILLGHGYEVHGLYRRSSVDNLWRIKHLKDKIKLIRGDLLDPDSIRRAIAISSPHEIYNFADQDDVGWSEVIPTYSRSVTYTGAERLISMTATGTKLFIPLSVLMFDGAPPPQNLQSAPNPKSVYAKAKYDLWKSCQLNRQLTCDVRCAIYFNHDSPGRSTDYVLQRICKEAVEIARGTRKKIVLNCLEQRIDIGYARDYAEAAYRIMQLAEPLDVPVGTGASWTLEEMTCIALAYALKIPVMGKMQRLRVLVESKGGECLSGRRADTSLMRSVLGWSPKTGIKDLIYLIVDWWEKNS